MPRPKVPGAPEPKRRSRTGCWTCKAKKVKCGEEKPRCLNCDRNGEAVCDYSIRLNWEGRSKRKINDRTPEPGEVDGPINGRMSKSATSTPMQQPLGSPSLSDVGPMIDPALILAGLPTNARDFSSQVPRMHAFSDPSSHPSPSDSMNDLGSPGISPDDGQAFRNQMLPPFQTDMFAKSMSTAFRGNKRVRHSSASDVLARSSTPEHSFGRSHHNSIPSTSTPYFGDSKIGSQAPSFFDSYSTTPRFPLTPSASSVNSEDIYPGPLSKPSPAVTFNPNDPRRLSVNSLLIQEENNARTRAAISPMEKEDPMSQVVPYGIDRGSVDLDTPINDDAHVLDVITPVIPNANFANDGEISTEFGFGLFANSNEKVACYTDPVTVKISRSLLPLPDLLQNHPMNLMYFHFFQEFTAKILVPHDCPANPFKIILPQMAVRDDNLLQLLLAYSASHRARMLGHPLPTNRIAVWVRDVFPSLRHALEDSAEQISNANVATAIMLASLEIIAPNTFEVAIPWQDHLSIARRMIIARGGPRAVNRQRDRVSYFLIRWFAYLDVLGSFSLVGARAEQAMFSGDLYDFDEGDDFQIDCVLGFSGHLASRLATIADLARRCDSERITADGELDPNWQPAPDVKQTAEQIKAELQAAGHKRYTLCPHRQKSSETEVVWESIEMAATNEAFHWAGMVHLNKRVLGLPQEAPEVQNAVRSVIGTLYKVRKGGSAEACLIFPLFTAGCEAKETSQRDIILERIKSVEASGMTQVHKARKLMGSVWETGKPWQTLVQGEFFG